MKKTTRIKNSVSAIKASSYAPLFRRINPTASFIRFQEFQSKQRTSHSSARYLTLPTAATILGIDRHTAARAITDPKLIPYERSSNGLRLIAPEVLRAFIVDLANAYGLRV
ncbi:hypothetical protein DES53_107301 [Roseimicrobium gellanilyticum]|uniref:Helix-turn-helix protein n=1 Tax=Roseimicrobium gellanilyticum TaxID=748857 RepID=A0A366HIP3_9BACT|nr:hypothetical protein DES53_107301 [Roseimicrobium gellanilyticum]